MISPPISNHIVRINPAYQMTTIDKTCTTTIKIIVYHINRPDKFIDLINFGVELVFKVTFELE